ncbi:hypothetical protein NYZ99_07360 [Maribacter litopenaei]|uniref:SGNH/GDSL hydrolase family protein n=1 Tax=Maribacter litopenaei TaxID=2976127 RepID=A0ABY5YAN1_9FLAO|nr:hypothetical protein [Maribacter litopenaei]UWX56110.1 hypothetical protein NYZ99_07360 [Maribacter litopenaei]
MVHISPYNAFNQNYLGEDVASLNLFYHQNEVIRNELDLLGQNNILHKIFWSQTYNGRLLGILKNFVKPQYDFKKYSGYDPLVVSDNQRKKFNQLLDRWTTRNCDSILSINSIYSSYIDEIKTFCETNNKVLIFYTSPIYRDDCKEDDLALIRILKEKNITYWNLSDFFEKEKSLENWKDNTHLSSKGAEAFTREIQIRMQNL